MEALIVGEHKDIEAFRGLLETAGTLVTALGAWEEARLLLARAAQPDVIVVVLDTLAAPGLSALLLARAELWRAKVPRVLAYRDATPAQVGDFRQFVDFAATIALPASPANIVAALNSAVPGIAKRSVSGLVKRPISREREAVQAAWSGWFERTAAVGFGRAQRLVVTMPSLTHGYLDTVPVPRLIYLLAVQRRRGLLTVESRGEPTLQACVVDGKIACGAPVVDPAPLKRAFAWREGSYLLDHETPVEGEAISTQRFVFEGLVEHVSFDVLAPLFAGFRKHYPVYTTLLTLRGDDEELLRAPRRILRECSGHLPLEKVVDELGIPLEEAFRAILFGMCTDAVALLDGPMRAPIGISYRLRSQETGESTPSDPGARARTPATTMQLIARLSAAEQAQLDRLNEFRNNIATANPYAVLGVQPGAGEPALQEAYFRLIVELGVDKLSADSAPTPLQLMGELVRGALRDAYQLAAARERDQSQLF